MSNVLANISIRLVATLIVLMLAGFSAMAQTMPSVKPLQVHIGIYAPFSEERAFIGRNILGGMEMAKDQLNIKDVSYSFYTLNKSIDTPVSAQTLQKFIDSHHIQVLVTEGSESGLMAAPVAKANNILHFSLADDPAIADGKNNFLAWNASYAHAAVLLEEIKPEFIAHYRKAYKSHPITEAGHAYDVFHIVHKSTQTAMKSKIDLSKPKPFDHFQVMAAGSGLMGPLSLDKAGVLYAKKEPAPLTKTVG